MSGKQPKIDYFITKKRKVDQIEGESDDVLTGELVASENESDTNTQKSSENAEQEEQKQSEGAAADKLSDSENESVKSFQRLSKTTKPLKQKQSNRKFHDDWQDLFFVTEYETKAMCLICRHEFGEFKKFSFERHFNTTHTAHNEKFPLGSQKRADEISRLKNGLKGEQKVFKKFMNTNELITRASYEISFEIAKRGKPYVDGEFHKELMLSTIGTLCENWEEKSKKPLLENIKKIPISHQTVSRRVNEIGAELEASLKRDLEKCDAFSIALDETTDIKSEAQLMFWVRYSIDNRIEENILALNSLTERTTAEDIFKSFLDTTARFNLHLKKLVSICSDGAPSMVGIRKGFVALVKKHIAEHFGNHNLITYHCIIHQENLCAKALQKSCNVTETVSKVCDSHIRFSYIYINLLLHIFTEIVLL